MVIGPMAIMPRREMLIGGGSAVLAGLLPTAARAAMPVPPGDRLGFDVLRKGSLLGTHVLTFASQGDRLTVKVLAVFTYKILGITVFHYTHNCIEVWDGSQVVALDTSTDYNGTPSRLTARRGPDGLVVDATGMARYTAPANALPATHWNQRELDGPWINTQNGKLLHPHVAPAGVETIPATQGRSLSAKRFDLSGDMPQPMVMYYDRIGWAGLSFKQDGAPIRYERQA